MQSAPQGIDALRSATAEPLTPPRGEQASAELRSPCEEPYRLPRSALPGSVTEPDGRGPFAATSTTTDEIVAALAAGSTDAALANAALADQPSVQPTEPASDAIAADAAADALHTADVAVDTRRTPGEIAALKGKQGKGTKEKTPREAESFRELPAGPFATKGDVHSAYERFLVARGHKKPFMTASRFATKERGAQFSLSCQYSKTLKTVGGY